MKRILLLITVSLFVTLNIFAIDADSIIGFVETWNEGSFGQGGLYNIVIYNGQCIKYPDIVKPVTYTTHVDGWGLGNP